MISTRLIGAALALLSQTAHAQQSNEVFLPARGAESCLEGGLMVRVLDFPGREVIAVSTVIGGGKFLEPGDKAGLTHITEHLWFTTSRPEQPPVWSRLEALGAEFNASTHLDHTAFTTIAAHSDLDALLRIESERFSAWAAGLSAEDVSREARILRQETRESERNITQRATERLTENLYPPTHAYAALKRESAASVGSITPADVSASVDRFWTPDNTSVLVVGDLSHLTDPIAAIAEKLGRQPVDAGACAASASEAPEPVPRYARDRKLASVEVATGQRHLIIGWALPAAWAEYDVFFPTLTQTANVLLYSALREKILPGWYGTPSCSVQYGRSGSVLMCRMTVSDGADVNRMRKRIGAYFDAILQDQLRRSGLSLLASNKHIIGFAPVEPVALMSMKAIEYTAIHAHHTGLLATGRDVLMEEKLDVIGRWLRGRRMASVVIEPSLALSTVGELPSHQRRTDDGSDAALSTWLAENITDTPYTTLPHVRSTWRTALDSGVEVLVLFRKDAVSPRAMLVLPTPQEPVPGTAELAWQTWDPPSRQTPIQGVEDQRIYWREGSWVLEVVGEPGELTASLFQLEKLARHTDATRYPWRDVLKALPSVPPTLSLQAELVGSTPLPTRREASAIGEATVDAWLSDLLHPNHARLIVITSEPTRSVQQAIQGKFADWNPDHTPEPRRTIPSAPTDRTLRIQDTATPQHAVVELSCRIDFQSAEERTAADVLARSLDTRLWAGLRNENAQIYSSRVHYEVFPQKTGVLSVVLDAQPAQAGPVLERLLDEISRFATGSLTNAELAMSIDQAAQAHRLSSRDPEHTMSEFAQDADAGLYIAEVLTWPERLSAVSTAQIRQLATQCAGTEHIRLTGPEAHIRTSLKDTDLGGLVE